MNETNISNLHTTNLEDSFSNLSYHHKKISNKLINTVPPRLMSETVRNIFHTFIFFDLNANQSIEINELKRILNALNFKKTIDECSNIINLYDLNNDQMIDFHEFIFALARLIKHDVFTLNDIQQRFNKFDDDQDGKLTVATLPLFLRKGLGISVNDREIFDLLAKFDITDENTKISFEKFIRMLQFVVRQAEKIQAPDYMKKLNHRCGPAVRTIRSKDMKLFKKRIGGYFSSSMEDTNK
ncbi:unnamed protein product [Adineta steineri]|uniref:EF-hand domain-containing protein n=1 Tax=Adineta steineri TaxID=433720 RepID=A0A815BHP9_9BILA|nr:unnamed protein product [Adineta steineri]CAF3733681.1 unnamed protein product [Adineta steineri]